jgi:hypothetical protein
MTGLTPRLAATPRLLDELFERQPVLARYAIVMFVLAAAAFAMQGIDPRTLASGINIWVKPTKFFLSVAVFATTAAWFFGYVRPERRQSLLMRATVAVLIAAGTFELVYICWQAAQAQESHFNSATRFHTVMYVLMGLGALLLTATTLPLAWEIARRPAQGFQRSFLVAVVIGLVMTFLLGAGFGGYMSSQPGNAVGLQGGQLPVFGWNRSGGDLRVAHFLGIHAEQAIPILAALTAPLAARARWAFLYAGTTAYVALTLGLFLQAVAGHPLMPA